METTRAEVVAIAVLAKVHVSFTWQKPKEEMNLPFFIKVTLPLINHYLINEIVLFSEFEFCWQLSYECSTLNFCWCFIHTHATPTWRLTFLFISIISRINWNSPASIRVFLIIIVLSSHWCWCYYIMNERVRVVFIWKGGCCWRCCCCHYQLWNRNLSFIFWFEGRHTLWR